MIVAIHQPNFFPWLGYFYKIYKADIFIFLDNVQFSRGSYTNRTLIKAKNDKKWLTVPVKAKLGTLINQVIIYNEKNWKRSHIEIIKLFYKNAPYFKEIFPLIEEIYFFKNWKYLVDLNEYFILKIAKILNLNKRIVKASDLNINGKSTELLVKLVKAVGGTTYLSGIGGKKYIDEELFRKENIKLIYSDFKHPTYPQLGENFIPGLSILDFLFNCGFEKLMQIYKSLEDKSWNIKKSL